MNYTTNYKFPKPEYSEFSDVQVLNQSFDAIDKTLFEKMQETDGNIEEMEQIKQDAITGAQDAANAIIGSKADKGTLYSFVLNYGNWMGEEPPYTNTISISAGLTGSEQELVEIFVKDSATTEQKQAWADAAVISGDITESGIIKIQALGEKPTVDIPLYIIRHSDLSGGGTP